jgi:hypothetical protein
MHENRQQNDDRQRNTDQPKQQSTAKSHGVLLRFCLVARTTPGNTLCSGYGNVWMSKKNRAALQ